MKVLKKIEASAVRTAIIPEINQYGKTLEPVVSFGIYNDGEISSVIFPDVKAKTKESPTSDELRKMEKKLEDITKKYNSKLKDLLAEVKKEIEKEFKEITKDL